MKKRHYDEYVVGAVGNANIILFMMNILFSIIAMATNVVAAQYLGAKLYKKMNMMYTLAVVVNLVFGLTLSAAFCVANPLIMDFLNVSPQMRPYSKIYIGTAADECIRGLIVMSHKWKRVISEV